MPGILQRVPRGIPGNHSARPSLPGNSPTLLFLTFLGIEDAGLTQLAEERAPAAGGLQVVQVEVGWVQSTGQVGEA